MNQTIDIVEEFVVTDPSDIQYGVRASYYLLDYHCSKQRLHWFHRDKATKKFVDGGPCRFTLLLRAFDQNTQAFDRREFVLLTPSLEVASRWFKKFEKHQNSDKAQFPYNIYGLWCWGSILSPHGRVYNDTSTY
jgi:hypothetical protein